MKKIIGFFAVVAMVAMISSCGGQKQIPAANQGDVEVSTPFSSAEYRSDANYFRATGIGLSPDQATAKKISLLNARTELATSVSAVIKAVTEQYIQNISVADKQEYASKFEETARQVVNTTLEGSVIKDDKTFKTPEGKFRIYTVVEMSKVKIEAAVEDAISKDDKLKLDFDKYQFQKVFDEEMAKFENK